MAELHRVLKAVTGWAILYSPVDLRLEETLEDSRITAPYQRRFFFGWHGHLRLYGLDFYDRLREAGFSVAVLRYIEELAQELVHEHVLFKDNG